MKRYRLSFVAAGALTTAVLFISIDYAAGQEIALAPMQAAEVAKGYRAEALRRKTVVNANRETIGRINDFVFD
jgi:hypothetical protein